MITVLTLLLVKHFIIDFPLQKPYQYLNKGTYGHPGGLLHSGLHGIGTTLCLIWWAPAVAICYGFVDSIVHYHIDWAKVNINNKFGWTSTNSEYFWWLLGLDQLLHALTYIAITYMVMR